jgi:hypothetical protein
LKHLGRRRQLLQRLVALARSAVELFLQIGGGCLCGRRFAGLGPNRAIALPFHRLSASTASLHVARLRRFTTMLNPRQILGFAPRQVSA